MNVKHIQVLATGIDLRNVATLDYYAIDRNREVTDVRKTLKAVLSELCSSY